MTVMDLDGFSCYLWKTTAKAFEKKNVKIHEFCPLAEYL